MRGCSVIANVGFGGLSRGPRRSTWLSHTTGRRRGEDDRERVRLLAYRSLATTCAGQQRGGSRPRAWTKVRPDDVSATSLTHRVGRRRASRPMTGTHPSTPRLRPERTPEPLHALTPLMRIEQSLDQTCRSETSLLCGTVDPIAQFDAHLDRRRHGLSLEAPTLFPGGLSAVFEGKRARHLGEGRAGPAGLPGLSTWVPSRRDRDPAVRPGRDGGGRGRRR